MLSRRFHPHDEAHMHGLPNALSPVGVGEMSFSLPPRFFHQKRKWKTRSCMEVGAGRGMEGGWLVVEAGERGVWERERESGEGGCSHLELLHFHWGVSSTHGPICGFIGRRRWREGEVAACGKGQRRSRGDVNCVVCLFNRLNRESCLLMSLLACFWISLEFVPYKLLSVIAQSLSSRKSGQTEKLRPSGLP